MERAPLFCGTELAARIERAEADLVSSAAEAARRREDVLVVPIAGGVAAWAGAESPLNKVAGLGFGGAVAEAELDAIEREFFARGTPVRAEVATLAEPGITALLTARGYRLIGFENVLASRLPAPPARTEVDVATIRPGELDRWLDVLVDGFAHPDTQGVPSDEHYPRDVLERVLGDLTTTPGFVHFLARRSGELAGAASVRIAGDIAQLTGAATLPAHRRHGVQTSLLATRLAYAHAQGCELVVVTTQPGSKSQQNVQRQGFELLYARAVLVREP
jgi:GNAT superfamily N-acetyltransferase